MSSLSFTASEYYSGKLDDPDLTFDSWGKGKNSWGIINTGNKDIELDALDGIADMVITPEHPFEGERFEKFKEMAKAAKVDGSLFMGQITHPGRQVQSRLTPTAISASDVQLGRYLFYNSRKSTC